MNQMMTMWPGNLNKVFTDAVIETGNSQPISPTGVGFNGVTPEVETIRKSEIRWINTYDQKYHFIVDTLWNFVVDANRNNYGFDLNYLRDIQYTTYHGSESGRYDWHQDIFWKNPTMSHRKLSVTVQLSEPDTYTGGEFEIDPEYGILDQNVIKQRGTVLVFPSFLRHRVKPVTSGVRRSLVAWIEGPKFK